jgi:hypothetical protein
MEQSNVCWREVEMAEPQKLKVIDNPSVGELYANKLVAASFDGGSVVITLGTARVVLDQNAKAPKEAAPPPVHVTARLAISPAGAVELANALTAMLKTLSQMQQKAAAAAQPNKTN